MLSCPFQKQSIDCNAEGLWRRWRVAKMQAEAKGTFEILSKQAEGFKQLVHAAGDNSQDAVMIMIADKLPELVKTQADAIKNIEIDNDNKIENINNDNIFIKIK